MHNRLILHITLCGLLNTARVTMTMGKQSLQPPINIGYYSPDTHRLESYKFIAKKKINNDRYELTYNDNDEHRTVICTMSPDNQKNQTDTTHIIIAEYNKNKTFHKYAIELENNNYNTNQ